MAHAGVTDAPIDIFDLEFQGFINEKQMCNYLEDNIILFAQDILGREYKYHKREYYVEPHHFGWGNKHRADFLLETTDGKRALLEVKNPKHIASEMIRSVSQLLAYGVLCDQMRNPVDELILVTSNTCAAVQLMIQKYELPITVVLMNRDILATWDREWATQWQDQLS